MRLVAAVLLIVLGGCGGRDPSGPHVDNAGGDMEVMWRLANEPHGSELEVRAEFGSSGLCRTFKKWEVDESSREVKVQAIVTQSSTEECTDDLLTERHTIRLAEPLGTRRLTGCDSNNVDASCDRIAPDENAEVATEAPTTPTTIVEPPATDTRLDPLARREGGSRTTVEEDESRPPGVPILRAELTDVRMELVDRLPDLHESGAFGVGIREMKNRVVVLSTDVERTRATLASLYPGSLLEGLVEVEQAEMPTTDFSG